MLQRKAYSMLMNWKKKPDKKALMVNGARQVGKTFLVREFGKREYESYVEMNFIKNPSLKSIFSGDLDVESIYKRMTAYIQGIKLIPGKTLIFMDEIQVCGKARTALKFLVEDGRFDVISSGSLLGLTYGQDDDPDVEEPESNPTGYEDFLTMYSLDFEEFLWAIGYDEQQLKILKEYFHSGEKIPDFIHEKYEELFREYIVVGGMPEVVAEFAKNKDFGSVDSIQRRIITDYQFDIAKHARGVEKIKIKACYDSIPKQLAKELKKFQYSLVEKGQTRKKYGSSITWLVDSGLTHICYNVIEPYLPLLGNSNDDQFKLYINDTGLLSAMFGFETKRAILNNTLKGNVKGGIYENVIAESLVKKGLSLYYYKPDNQHEIEFLLEKDGEVIPLEVKAGNNVTPSLNRFIEDFKPSLAYKLVNGNQGKNGIKITMPHYMVMFL